MLGEVRRVFFSAEIERKSDKNAVENSKEMVFAHTCGLGEL